MRVVALASQKGGVGKSFLAANLACEAVASGATVAVIDMDPQHTTLGWGERRADLFPQPAVLGASDPSKLTSRLADLHDDKVDWVFIDLPGRDTAVTAAGMRAANYVLIPARPLEVDIEPALNTARIANQTRKPYAFVINASPPQGGGSRAKEAIAMLKKAGHTVAPTIITNRIQIADAHSEGRSIGEFEGGVSGAQFAALFKWLTTEVMEPAQ